MKYKDMNNTEIRKITYSKCPLKCTSCEALCNEMAVGQCKKNLSQAYDDDNKQSTPECFKPEKNNPYPLCIGNGSTQCNTCCLYVNYPEPPFN